MTRRNPISRGRVLLSIVVLFAGLSGVASPAEAQEVDCAEKRRDFTHHYPILATDEFEIVFIDACVMVKVWSDSGTGGSAKDVSLWVPDFQFIWSGSHHDDYATFRSPGTSFLRAQELDDGDEGGLTSFLIRPRPGFEDRMRYTGAPGNPEVVWTDAGTGADDDLWIIEPKCDPGYVPLGVVAGQPQSDGLRFFTSALHQILLAPCFREASTHQLDRWEVGPEDEPSENGSFWDDDGTGGSDEDIAFFGVVGKEQPNLEDKNTALLPPATFWVSKNGRKPPPISKFRGIKLPIAPLPLHGRAHTFPELTEASVVPGWPEAQSTTQSGGSVSALVVVDKGPAGTWGELTRVVSSPEYYVHRTTSWKPVANGSLTCPTDSEESCPLTVELEESESESTTWNNTFGVSVGVTVTGEANFAPLGVGGKASVSVGIEASYSHEFGGETSTSTSESIGRGFFVRPGHFGLLVREQSVIEVYRYNDKNRDPANLVRRHTATARDGSVRLAEYDARTEADLSAVNCSDPGDRGRDLINCGLPAADFGSLPRNEPIFSGSHYLILSNSGALEIRDADVGLSQHTHTWSLDEKHQHGQLHHDITGVQFKDGRLSVAAHGIEDWTSSDDAHPGALVDISESGHLVVYTTRADGRKVFIWNSEFD